MTPRSVQIWFQNRRQRLLKPQMRGEGEGGEGEFGEDELNARDEGAVGAGALAGLAHHGSQQRSAAMQLQRTPSTEAPLAVHTNAMGLEVQEAGHAMQTGMDSRLQVGSPHYPSFVPPQSAGVPSAAQMMLQQMAHAAPQQGSLPSPSSHGQPSVAAPPPVSAQHPYPVSGPVTAAHLVAAGVGAPLLRGEAAGVGGASALDGSQTGIGAAMSLPTLVSRLGTLMMGTACAPDLALGGLPHALAMLPQAVAAGHVSPGAAALLMQALQAQMGHLETAAAQQMGPGGAAAWPTSPPAEAAPAGADPSWSNVEMQGQAAHNPQQHPSYQQQHAASPSRAPLPHYLGGPTDANYSAAATPASSQQQSPSGYHNGLPAQLPLPPALSMPPSYHPPTHPPGSSPLGSPLLPSTDGLQPPTIGTIGTPAAPPPKTGDQGVDALLLLSACADVQRQEDEEPPAAPALAGAPGLAPVSNLLPAHAQHLLAQQQSLLQAHAQQWPPPMQQVTPPPPMLHAPPQHATQPVGGSGGGYGVPIGTPLIPRHLQQRVCDRRAASAAGASLPGQPLHPGASGAAGSDEGQTSPVSAPNPMASIDSNWSEMSAAVTADAFAESRQPSAEGADLSASPPRRASPPATEPPSEMEGVETHSTADPTAAADAGVRVEAEADDAMVTAAADGAISAPSVLHADESFLEMRAERQQAEQPAIPASTSGDAIASDTAVAPALVATGAGEPCP